MATSLQVGFESKNAILAQLPLSELPELRRGFQLVDLVLRQVLYEPNQPVVHAYFPEAGMISIVAQMADGNSIEVGTIGREGMCGSFLLLDTDRMPHRYFTQVEGRAQRISA